MEEDQYRQTYRSINPLQCPYEKAINSRMTTCARMERFCLADREGVACTLASANERCKHFLNILRPSAKFALHLTHVDGPLPHSKEIKVQIGGIKGIASLLNQADENNIDQLLSAAQQQYGSLEQLPYDQILKVLVHFEARKKRRRD